MSDFGYSGSPSPTDKLALVRLILGDTDSSDPIFTDGEITTILTLQPIVSYAAASLAEMAAAKFARQVQISIGSTSVQAQLRHDHYRDLALRLRRGGPGILPGGDGSGSPTVSMIVGGVSRAEKKALDSDSGALQPSFSIGQDDYPGTGVEDNARRQDEYE